MEHPCAVLPGDVIENISTRLPARTVLGYRGLSRAWAAALSFDDFVDRHRRASNSYVDPRFFLSYRPATFNGTHTVACLP
jgi:hypothetical protein